MRKVGKITAMSHKVRGAGGEPGLRKLQRQLIEHGVHRGKIGGSQERVLLILTTKGTHNECSGG